MDYVKLSKEMSYALRHAPWEYELELDDEGFAPIGQLLAAINEGGGYGRDVTISDLHEAISRSDKKRHEVVGNRIRALYGHTVPKKIEKEAAEPPATLYHGTTHKAAETIRSEGLKPMGRQYVHLSLDMETAQKVGARRDSDPVILAIDSAAAFKDGTPFYIGNDKVWLADEVPARFIKIRSLQNGSGDI